MWRWGLWLSAEPKRWMRVTAPVRAPAPELGVEAFEKPREVLLDEGVEWSLLGEPEGSIEEGS